MRARRRIDPRWLVRALCEHYDGFLEVAGPADAEGWRITPEDYLEKILNIPIVLPGIRRGDLKRLLAGMLEPSAPEQDEPRTDQNGHRAADDVKQENTAPGKKANPASSTEQPPTFFEPGSEAAAAPSGGSDLPPRPLTDGEIATLAALEPLVRTPREAKRLLNLYRLLRSTRDLSTASTFLGSPESPGEHQVVIALLGLLTGQGRLIAAVLDTPARDGARGGLLVRPPNEPWSLFVTDLSPSRDTLGWRNQVIGPIEEAHVDRWTLLADGMAAVSETITPRPLTPFQDWAPRVRRFAFSLGGPVPSRSARKGSDPPQ